MTKENNEKIEIKYNEKTYEIDKDAKEQKVRPKGIIFTQGDPETNDNKEVTFKNYQEGFWNTSVEADDNKLELKWGAGKHLSAWGTPSIVLAIVGFFLYQKFKKPIDSFIDKGEELKKFHDQIKENK